MATGISAALALGALALLFVTFRNGVALYQKILGYLTIAGLAYFYYPELLTTYRQVSGGAYKNIFREFASLLQVAMPAVAFALLAAAFLISSALDTGKILVFLFVLFFVSALVKIISLV